MQASGHPDTTLTRPGTRSGAETLAGWALMWIFPSPSAPPWSLELCAGEERAIGRDASCSLCLRDADVSRRHARLAREATAIVLSDLGSRNGTHVNGAAIQRAALSLGDVVRLGGSVGIVTDRVGPVTELRPGLLAGPLLGAELENARVAAPSDLPMILEGETGTGKEVVARAIHAWSGRTGPYLAVNCAALPEALAEGELFGYRKGAFTGADRASPGLFRSARGGTLLLDEVCDLPLVLQAKLLRVLEQREVLPLGEVTPVAVDARILVATQEPLREVVRRRQFRQDLLARLEGVTIRLPPLRARVADVPALFSRAFLEQSAGQAPALEAEFVEHLCLHDWPFNVREVVLLAKRLRVLCGDRLNLEARDLPAAMSVRVAPAAPALSLASEVSVNAGVELPALLGALRTCNGNVARAAGLLGISRQRAYRLMQGKVDLDELRGGGNGADP